MLGQFQDRYPTGSLISELLTIYQGKFVVRVSAQVEGITRATGMAAAETPEVAEDRARSRALAVLVGIDTATPTLHGNKTAEYSDRPLPPQPAPMPEQPIQINAPFSPEPIKQTNTSRPFATTARLNEPGDSSFLQASPQEESTPAPEVSVGFPGKSDAQWSADYVKRFALTPTPAADVSDAAVEDLGMMSGTQNGSSGEAPISFNNVTPLVPRSYSPQESAVALGQTSAETEIPESDPVDLSDAIARTSVELKRLRWSDQQGREYLKRKYAKRSRKELTDEEMLEFLDYLESQPTPNEPFA